MALNDFDTKHYKNVDSYLKGINIAFSKNIKRVQNLYGSYRFPKNASINNYPVFKKQLDKELKKLSDRINTTIVNGVKSEWKLANFKNDKLVDLVFENKDVPDKIKSLFKTQNNRALSQFLNRTKDNFTISERVWNLTAGYKNDIEKAVSLAIYEGTPSTELARNLQQYLNNPDSLYHKVRDKTGKLHLSKPAKSFNPGRGVYRSAYKNAYRLARTEINMAYRKSDHERWSQMDFVTGYEIKRSNNYYECDICESRKGIYPKDFYWHGWHPQCRCYMVPIVLDDKQFDNYLDDLLAGKKPDTSKFMVKKHIHVNYTTNYAKNLIIKKFKGPKPAVKKFTGSKPIIKKQYQKKVQKSPLKDPDIDYVTKAEIRKENFAPVTFKNRDEMHKYFEKYENDFEKITKDEMIMVKRYTGSDHYVLNRYLRNPKDHPINENYKNFKNVLHGAIQKFTIKDDLVLYRGVGSSGADFMAKLLKMKPGEGYNDLGFMSASLDVGVAKSFSASYHPLLKITVRKGTKGIPVEYHTSVRGEMEVLFQNETNYKFLGKSQIDYYGRKYNVLEFEVL